MGKVKATNGKSKGPAAVVAKVKDVVAAKTSQAPAVKSKKGAKEIAVKSMNGKKQKPVEDETSDSDSDSEDVSEDSDSASDDESEDDSDSSSEDDSDDAKPTKIATNGAAAAAGETDSSDDSESDDEEVAKPKTNGSSKAAVESDSDSSDSSDEEVEEKTKKVTAVKAVNGKSKAKDEDSSDDDDEEADSDDSDSSEESEAEVEKAEAPAKKRKALDDAVVPSKKAKTEDSEGKSSTLFVGSLAWAVDDAILYAAFEEFADLLSARVVTDKNTGRSRGFGYVDFSSHEAAAVAFEAMQGKEIEGRAMNLDFSQPRTNTGDANPQARAADRAKRHGDVASPPSDTLFVGNLPFDVDQDSVRSFFSEVCEVTSVRLPTDPESGNLKGFGYVSFTTVDDATTVFNSLNGQTIGEGRSARAVRLDYASARPPPREGGGFGGGRGGGGGGFGRGGGGRGGGRGGARGGPRGGGRGGGRGGSSFNRGGYGDFKGQKITF